MVKGVQAAGKVMTILIRCFDQAVEFVVEKHRASISGVQRQFSISYNRAARIIEQMKAQGYYQRAGA